MRHLKVLGMAVVAAMALTALSSVAVSAAVGPEAAVPVNEAEQAALVALFSTGLLAAIGIAAVTTRRVDNQRKKTMTHCYVSSETRDITNTPISEIPSENTTRDPGNNCYVGSIEQQPTNEKANEKRHLTFRLAEAYV